MRTIQLILMIISLCLCITAHSIDINRLIHSSHHHWHQLLSHFPLIADRHTARCVNAVKNITDMAINQMARVSDCYAQLGIIDGNNDHHCRSIRFDLFAGVTGYDYDQSSDLWSLRMFDAWGRLPVPGSMRHANQLAYGSYTSCMAISSVERDYCRLQNMHFEHFIEQNIDELSDAQPRIFVGLCLPAECDSRVIRRIGSRWNLTLECFCDKDYENIFEKRLPAKIIYLIYVTTVLAMCIIGTIIDRRHQKYKLERRNEMKTDVSSRAASSIGGIESHLTYKSARALKTTLTKPGDLLRKVFTAFSVSLNVRWVLRGQRHRNYYMKVKSGHIECVYGIRVLSMLGLILAHTYVLSLPHVPNVGDMIAASVPYPWSQLVLSSSLHVDTFFVLSGLLTAYVHAQQYKRNCEKSDRSCWRFVMRMVVAYVHRYSRLIVPYATVLLFAVLYFAHIGSGPAWIPGQLYGMQCDDLNNIWQHLLFVINLLSVNCMPWMWYLAAEFQFFILAIPLLHVLHTRPKIGGALILSTVVSTAMAKGLLTVENAYAPNLLLFLDPHQFHPSQMKDAFTRLYSAPHYRIAPFLIGLLAGYLLSDIEVAKTRLTRGKKMAFICGSFGFLLITALAPYPIYLRIASKPYIFLYASLSRPIWALCIALLIGLCHTNNAFFFGSIIEHELWRAPARLCYCVYLLHEIVLVFYYQSRQQPIYFDGHWPFLMRSSGVIVTSFMLALPLTIMFELPTLALERLVFKKRVKPMRRKYNKPSRTVHFTNTNRKTIHLPTISPEMRLKQWVQSPNMPLSSLPLSETQTSTVSHRKSDDQSTQNNSKRTRTSSDRTQMTAPSILDRSATLFDSIDTISGSARHKSTTASESTFVSCTLDNESLQHQRDYF